MTSWERRRRRRVRVTVCAVLFFAIAIIAFVVSRLMLPYETWELNEFYNVTFDGYNGNGTAAVALDPEKLDAAIEHVKQDYRESFFHLLSVTDADYDAFKNSLTATLTRSDGLSNGDQVGVNFACDQDLAKKLKISVNCNSKTYTAEGLPDVTVLTPEDVFKDLSVTFDGISPDLTLTITNNSTDPFLSNMVFQPVEPKERYAAGDIITIRAHFSEEEALKQNYVVSVPSEECTCDYTVTAERAYITSALLLPDSVVERAKNAGLDAFVNANEYGVRIFCEAGLVPVYVNKQATFEWVDPTFRSAYFKCANETQRMDEKNHFNDLDIVYEVSIKQANGVACSCYAVVRFSDLILNADGSVDGPFSSAKVMSCDYKVDNVHKTVVENYEGTHTVTKVGGR